MKIWNKYVEPKIKFRPTYKLKPRILPLSYEISKGRLPSYWDRIMYKPSPDISCTLYDAGDYSISDHLPVMSQFELYIENTEGLGNEDYRLSVTKDKIQALNLDRNTSQVPMYKNMSTLSVPDEDDIPLPILLNHVSEPYRDEPDLELESRNIDEVSD